MAMRSTVVLLEPDGDAAQVAQALRGLGLWATRLQGIEGVGFNIEPPSPAVATEVLAEIPGVATVLRAASAHPKVDAQAGQGVGLGDLSVGGGAPVRLFAGPCSVESPEQMHAVAQQAAAAGATVLRGGAFKPRTSPYSFRGHGAPALGWLREAADRYGLKVVTEVMTIADVPLVAAQADLLQIGSRNMQNFDLLRAVGGVGHPVMLKRAMSATVSEWLMAGEHLLAAGASAVLFCERGIKGFDPSTRNVLDLGAVSLLKHALGQPVVVDPSHAAGRRDLILPLTAAAIAAGADAVMLEVHPNPGVALSDGAQALLPDDLATLAPQFISQHRCLETP
jgi:3-deoxy-7-phosphoheptulonate synthase